MQQTTDFSVQTLPQSIPAAAVRLAAKTRMGYIDLIRTVLIVLVIMLHAAVANGAVGDWTFIDPGANDEMSSILLSLFVIDVQAFSMSLYFFFSGYFTPGSFDRKGPLKFWKDRLLHLALPMLLYTFVLSRLPNYLDEAFNHGLSTSFWQFSLSTFITDADEGPTWFLFALLIFSMGYTLWRFLSRGSKSNNPTSTTVLKAPSTFGLLGLAVGMALAMFIVAQFLPVSAPVHISGIFSLLLGFFPFYILFFIGGTLAFRNNWLEQFPAKMLRFWSWLSLALIVILPAFLILTGAVENGLDEYTGGFSLRCAVFCLWIALACVSFSMSLSLWLRDHVKPGSRLAAFAGHNTFGVYLIHPLILVPITLGFSYLAIHPLIKFGITSVLTVIMCFGLAEVLRRVPGLKAIL